MARKLDASELAHIQKAQPVSIVEFDLDLNVTFGSGLRWIDVEATRHSQMHHHHPGVRTLTFQPKQDVLRPALNCPHPRANNPLLKFGSRLSTQRPLPGHASVTENSV